jgi:hypothetical protein
VTLDAMFFGAFFGLVAAVAIYHLLMYAILRVPEFLSYGSYLAALTVFQLGRYPQYLSVLGLTADAKVLFWWTFAVLAFLGYWLFRTFLSLRTMQPRLERIFLALTCLFARWRRRTRPGAARATRSAWRRWRSRCWSWPARRWSWRCASAFASRPISASRTAVFSSAR